MDDLKLETNCPLGRDSCENCFYLSTCKVKKCEMSGSELYEKRFKELMALPKEMLIKMILGNNPNEE